MTETPGRSYEYVRLSVAGWVTGEEVVERDAVRQLGLIMVPGQHVVKVEVQREGYRQQVTVT